MLASADHDTLVHSDTTSTLAKEGDAALQLCAPGGAGAHAEPDDEPPLVLPTATNMLKLLEYATEFHTDPKSCKVVRGPPGGGNCVQEPPLKYHAPPVGPPPLVTAS